MSDRSSSAGALGRMRALDPALVLLALMVFVVQVGVAVMLPLLPLYALSLGASPFVLGLLTSVFAVTNAAGQLVTGFLAERFAMRRLLAAGIGSYAIANFLIAGATTAVSLVLFRAFAGIGGGVMIVGERLYLAQLVDRARLAFANGVLSAAGSAGMVAGPAIGGVLASLADLRAPFLLVGVTSLLATVGAFFLPRTRAEQERAQGVVAPSASAAGSDSAAPSESAVASESADRVAAADQPSPASAPQQAADLRQLGILLLAQVGLMSAFGSFITTYGPFAEQRLGWLTAEVGIVFALFGLGSIVFGPWLGRQADRRGRRNIAIVAALPVIAFSIVYWLELPRAFLYVSAILAGGGVAGVQAAWFALLGDATDGGRRGRVFSTVAALSNMGIIVGATVAAQLWEATGDVSMGFVVGAISMVGSAVAFMALPADRPAPTAGGQARGR
jgi:MFS transporter, DHA1 family, multidrug resistance protein